MKFNTTAMTSSSLEQFRALVMAQEALADSLSQAVDTDRFVDLAMRSASAHGIALGAEAVRAEIRPDPLGLAAGPRPR